MARSRKVVANNKKARHDYFVEETYEAGIALTGTEIKSVRAGRVSIKESYAHIITAKSPSWACTSHRMSKATAST